MKELNRREFLRTGLLAAGAFFVAVSPLRVMAATDTGLSLAQLKKKAKEHFYKREYAQAAQYYRDIIDLQPDNIFGYDGLARVFRAQNRLLEAAETYREGWLTRRRSPVFTDRLALSMRRLAAGNRKQERAFRALYGEDTLYEAAAQLYLDVSEEQQEASEHLSLGAMDVQKSVEKHNRRHRGRPNPEPVSLEAATVERIERIEEPVQSDWADLRRNRKKREYNVQSEVQLGQRITKRNDKVRRDLHFEEERASRERELVKSLKGLYYPLFNEALERKFTNKAEQYYEGIMEADSSDSNAAGQLIHHYRRRKEYVKLVNFQRQRHEENPNDIWLAISYAQALRLQAKKENIPGQYNTAYALYRQLGQSDNLGAQEKLAIYGGEIDCLFSQKRYAEAKNAIIRVMAPYPMPVLSYLIVYIKCLIEEGKYQQAGDAFQILLHGEESSTLASDPIYPYLKNGHILIKLPGLKKPAVEDYGLNKEGLFDIYYAMVGLYEKSGDGGAKTALLNIILEIDPNNRFALKRL